jgi:thiazole/oxazole-forming peptide maturase SagD family component
MNVTATDPPAARAERCLGPLAGLATGLSFRQADRSMGEYAVPELTTAAVGRTVPGADEGSIDLTVGGGGETVTEATLTALGELLERYSMHWPVPGRRTATHAELRDCDAGVVDLAALTAWDEADLVGAGFEPVDEHTPVEWVPGTALPTGREVYVPAGLVASTSGDGRDRFPSSTSGNACGSSLAGGLARSLYEQVERDAVMRTWYEGRTPPRLDISAFTELERFRRRITPDGYRLHVLDLPTPTDCRAVGAMLVNEADRVPKFRLFAGAHHSLGGALRDALSEATEGLLQTRYRLAAGDTPDPDIDIESAYDFDDNVRYYMQPDHFDAVAHFADGDVRTVDPNATTDVEPSPKTEVEPDLDRALAAVRAGEETTPIGVDRTPPDVRELGMYTTAVYVPELVDMALPALPPVDHPGLSRVETTAAHPFP